MGKATLFPAARPIYHGGMTVAESPAGSARERTLLDTLAPYLAVILGLLSFIALIVARFVYQAPCLTDCAGRSWQQSAQQIVAAVALIPVTLVIIALLRKETTWLKITVPIMLSTYITWIVLIVQG